MFTCIFDTIFEAYISIFSNSTLPYHLYVMGNLTQLKFDFPIRIGVGGVDTWIWVFFSMPQSNHSAFKPNIQPIIVKFHNQIHGKPNLMVKTKSKLIWGQFLKNIIIFTNLKKTNFLYLTNIFMCHIVGYRFFL